LRLLEGGAAAGGADIRLLVNSLSSRLPTRGWGERVGLTYDRADKSATIGCEPKAVNSRGVIVEHKEAVQYYPWHAIVRVELGEKKGRRHDDQIQTSRLVSL
jgi:hypothetical protein